MMDCKDLMVQRESEDRLDCRDFQEHQDFRVCRGRTDLRAREVLQAATGRRGKLVTREIQEFLASRADLAPLVCQEKRATQVT